MPAFRPTWPYPVLNFTPRNLPKPRKEVLKDFCIIEGKAGKLIAFQSRLKGYFCNTVNTVPIRLHKIIFMGRLLFFILGVYKYFRLLWLRITGSTEADIHANRIVTGRAWSEFCEHLKTAGAALAYQGAPRDAFQQAEGVRYLSRLTRAALEAYVEYGDVEFPELRRMVHETVKLGADNPDNYYMNAQISGNFEYRITGKRNTIDYIGFFTQNGGYGTAGGMLPCGVLESKDLRIEEDGSFEIILSTDKEGDRTGSK